MAKNTVYDYSCIDSFAVSVGRDPLVTFILVAQRLTSYEMESATQVRILDKAVGVSFRTISLRKGTDQL